MVNVLQEVHRVICNSELALSLNRPELHLVEFGVGTEHEQAVATVEADAERRIFHAAVGPEPALQVEGFRRC